MKKELTKWQILYQKYRKHQLKYIKSHPYSSFSASRKARLIELKKKYMDKYLFGGLKETVLKRDNYKCQLCGMTQQEHIEKWKRNLTIDHIDGNGFSKRIKNNNIDNLRALCCVCHGRYDYYRTLPMRKARRIYKMLKTK